MRSCSTPFVAHTIGTSAFHSTSREWIGGVSCVFAVIITMSSLPGATSSIDVTASTSTTSVPPAVRSARPVPLDRRHVRRPGDDHHLGATLAQAPADHAANGPSPVDDHSHRRNRTAPFAERAGLAVGGTGVLFTGGAPDVLNWHPSKEGQ